MAASSASIDGYQPLFQRAEMMVLRSQVDQLERRMCENKEWNLGEMHFLLEIIGKMTDIVDRAKRSTLLPSLGDLKTQYSKATEDYDRLYRATTNLLSKEPLFARVSETCKSIQVISKNPRNPMEIGPLYMQALAICDEYAKCLRRTFEGLKGVTVEIGPIKKIVRLLEKMVMQSDGSLGCSVIMDVVRGMLLVTTHESHVDVLDAFKNSPHFNIYKVQSYRYDEYKEGRWLDTKVIAALKGDPNQFKTETQIVHKKMCAARDQMGGHDNYANFRALGEAITLAEARGGGKVLAKSALVASLESELETAKQARDWAQCKMLKEKLATVSKAEADIASVQHQLDLATKEDDYDLCEKLDAQLAKLRSTVETVSGFQQPPKESMQKLVQMPKASVDSVKKFMESFPNCSFDKYRASTYHQINLDFPKLRLVHENPFIFFVDLLSKQTCRDLMMKAGVNMNSSKMGNKNAGATAPQAKDFHTKWPFLNGRTSSVKAIPEKEVPGLRQTLQTLLNAPHDQFQPFDVLRYTKGQEFGVHHDSHPSRELPDRRMITVFIYLNDVEEGGETVFCGNQYKARPDYQVIPEVIVKPCQGMAVIHFPVDRNGVRDWRSEHCGMPAVTEKFVGVQRVQIGKCTEQRNTPPTGDAKIL